MSDPLKKIKEKLQDEIAALERELSIDLPKEIAVARAHGDLSENAEYKFAKERQGYVNAKISDPANAKITVSAIGRNIFPSTSWKLRIGR